MNLLTDLDCQEIIKIKKFLQEDFFSMTLRDKKRLLTRYNLPCKSPKNAKNVNKKIEITKKIYHATLIKLEALK